MRRAPGAGGPRPPHLANPSSRLLGANGRSPAPSKHDGAAGGIADAAMSVMGATIVRRPTVADPMSDQS